ncbi:MAG TPA: hypothetical protein VGK93_06255 [Candidatus Eisenbacteria bacterium]
MYLEGPEESVKAALLAELRHAWARGCPEAPTARVLRAAESTVEEILAAYHARSLFTPRELVIVLDVEDLGRGERKVAALAEGLSRPSGGSSLVLVEGAAEAPRKSLEPLRAACQARWAALPLPRTELLEWGARRLRRHTVKAERRVLELVADACEGDPAAFFDELDKLATCVGDGGQVTEADVATLLRPMLGTGLPEYLSAVALGRPALAAQRLGGMLAAGVREGAILFALGNLVGGALGGWTRYRESSDALRRRDTPAELAAVLDALYRAEAAWKGGRADAIAVLEHVTRVAAGAGSDRTRSA